MPVHFGGYDYAPAETCYHDVVNMGFTFATDEAALSAYIPEGLELLRPEFTINFTQSREIDWMAGGAYNLIDVFAPVRFRSAAEDLEGIYSFVVWENKTTPILTGREKTGVSKLFADIEDLHIFGDKRFTAVSFDCNTFLRLSMTVEGPADEQETITPVNAIHWRYIPKIGGPGADLSQLVLFPQRLETQKTWRGSGVVEWFALTWEQHPTQAHIIQALAGLPTFGPAAVMLTKDKVFLMDSMARVLE